jgi:mono/diheme cytochrome c family protein
MSEPSPPWAALGALAVIGMAIGGAVAWHRMHRIPALPAIDPGMQRALPADDPDLGRRVYAHCQGCHGIDGAGISGASPALNASGWLRGDARPLIRMVLHGYSSRADVRSGPSLAMPAFAGRLADHEIAGVLSWLRARWAPGSPAVDPAAVTAERRASAGRTDAWTPSDLMPSGNPP